MRIVINSNTHILHYEPFTCCGYAHASSLTEREKFRLGRLAVPFEVPPFEVHSATLPKFTFHPVSRGNYRRMVFDLDMRFFFTFSLILLLHFS